MSGPRGVGTKFRVGGQLVMASAVARAYNGGLGAEPLVGGQGQSPPEAEKPFAFAHPAEALLAS